MCADPNPFRILTTRGYERDFRAISRGRPSVIDAMEELLAILRRDPYNRSGRHQIKKLTGCKVGEGQWRIRWKECRLRYDLLESDVVCTRFGTGRRVINCAIPLSGFARQDSRGQLSPHDLRIAYFPASSRFTASLTTFPSTRIPAPEKRAIAFFITAPMSFIVGAPISAITAFTPAMISSSPAACGR